MQEIKKDLPYIVIAGATATGKTAAAAELALLIGGEVISADSMQVYKYMDIGTAKPAPDELKGIPHYLIDELFPDEAYSAYEFKTRADAYARNIRLRGKYPIICGGTGFYINALVYDTDFPHIPSDAEYRAQLYAFAEAEGADALHGRLARCDPQAAAEIHPNNVKRVVRALEFYKQAGVMISEHNAREKERRHSASAGNARFAVLTMERPLLNERINQRVDRMITAGLEAEARGLLERGYAPGLASMQGLGYKEMIRYIHGEYSFMDAVNAIKTGTRQYAKRQQTWFSRQINENTRNTYDTGSVSDPRALAQQIARDFSL